jgi:hypothetical protein
MAGAPMLQPVLPLWTNLPAPAAISWIPPTYIKKAPPKRSLATTWTTTIAITLCWLQIYTLKDNQTNPNASGNNRKNMMRSVEESLKRLKTDFIDVLYLHIWDDITPIDEVLRGLDDLIRQGKVNYTAISDTPAWVVAKGNTLAELMGWSQFIALQVEYSLLQRTPERELIPWQNISG